MTQYSLASPPKTAGIYALKNLKTGHVYIGQSVNLFRRWVEWKAVMQNGIGRTSADMIALARSRTPEEWVFTVMAEAEGDRLNDVEDKCIRRVKDQIEDLCLNRQPITLAPTTGSAEKNEFGRKSEVIGANGVPMTHREVAAACGVTAGTVSKKLQKLRERGVTRMTLDDYQTQKFQR